MSLYLPRPTDSRSARSLDPYRTLFFHFQLLNFPRSTLSPDLDPCNSPLSSDMGGLPIHHAIATPCEYTFGSFFFLLLAHFH